MSLAWGDAPIPELSNAEKREAQELFEQIRADPRGPYGPIRWYCNDGRVLPAQGTPCGEVRGYQHASPNEAAEQLARYNFDLARFLAGMSFEEFLDQDRNHFWLRQMILIDFLEGGANGWIYGKTYARRGVRQAEDEERAGRRLLIRLLEDFEWVERNYLLTILVGEVTPHGLETSNLRRIRSLSAALAAEDSRFQAIRGKIHSKPEASDVERVAAFIRDRKPANTEGFNELLGLMREEYDERGFPSGWRFARGAERSVEIRRLLSSPGLDGSNRLALLDEQLKLQNFAFRTGSETPAGTTRRRWVENARHWAQFAAGGGLVSMRQLAALEEEFNQFSGRSEVSSLAWSRSVHYVEMILGGMTAAVYRELGEVVQHYQTLEPLAAGLVDDVLRRSVALPLSNRAESLVWDADLLAGRRHRVLGDERSQGVRALNPGVAIAPLAIAGRLDYDTDIRSDRIWVIPATAAHLKPVEGILTLDSGNALSHAQLLAANLGIPNATLPSALLPELRKLEGEELFFAVTPGETVVLLPWNSLSPQEQANWRVEAVERKRVDLDTSRLDLSNRRVTPLSEIASGDSGVRCGPKAANLGQLKRHFPERVSPGLVVPFGVYYAHVTRTLDGGESIFDRIRVCYEEAERMRESGASSGEVLEYVRPRLADFRRSIREMPLEKWFVDETSRMMREVFGPDGSYGVFVRSDTNAEDLPEFSGAGLNLTVPNVVGTDKILRAIKDVWASPFEERAYQWRAEAVVSSAEVFPSVVLAKTVGTTKSGVIATANLRTLSTDEITVNANEGTAAVVDGGVAESILLKPDGSVRLLAQAQAAYVKYPLPRGGMGWKPTSGSDYVLSEDDIREIRELVREVNARFPKQRDASGAILPWDIEFGFLDEKLHLFQIRPLVRYRQTKLLEALAAFEGATAEAKTVNLDETLEGE